MSSLFCRCQEELDEEEAELEASSRGEASVTRIALKRLVLRWD